MYPTKNIQVDDVKQKVNAWYERRQGKGKKLTLSSRSSRKQKKKKTTSSSFFFFPSCLITYFIFPNPTETDQLKFKHCVTI